MKRLKAILDFVATVVVLSAAVVIMWRQLQPTASPRQPERVQTVTGKIPAAIAKNSRGSGHLALVEFADYQCPYCGQHARDVDPIIRSEFVDTGVVREIFVNFPLSIHAQAQKASEAAECAAAQGRFWEMHQSLFSNQSALAASELEGRADQIGLDKTRFSKCLSAGESTSIVEAQKRLGQQLEVTGTPSFFLGTVSSDGTVDLKRRLNGVLPAATFEDEIRKLSSDPKATPEGARLANTTLLNRSE